MPQNLLTAEGLVAAPWPEQHRRIASVKGVVKTQEENTKFPQQKHKPHSYRAERSDKKIQLQQKRPLAHKLTHCRAFKEATMLKKGSRKK